jgi:hypothetical protein
MRPRRYALRGRQPVEGWLLPAAPEGEAQRRVLAAWVPGAVLLDVGGAWWLRLPAARRLRAPFPAVPVVAARGRWTAVELDDAAWEGHEGLDPVSGSVPGSLIHAVHGALRVVRPADQRRLDPSTWLAPSPAPVARPWTPPPPAPPEVRWTGVPEPDEASAPPAEPSGPLHRLRSWLGGEADARARLWERWLDRTEELFREGKVDEALRRAIAFGRSEGAKGPIPSLQPLRKALTPGLRPGKPGGSIPIAADRLDRLSRSYRDAVERLVDEGRIEAAAFVLADLLGDPHEAIDLLAAHGHHRLAAQLCERHEQQPARAVRLYLLAGDVQEATRLARSAHVFAEARRLLGGTSGREHPTERAELDLLHAAWCDAQHDAVGALRVRVRLVLEPPTPEIEAQQRQAAADALAADLPASGPLEGELLLLRWQIAPDGVERDGIARRLRAIIQQKTPLTRRQRRRLLDALGDSSLTLPPGLANPLARALAADAPAPEVAARLSRFVRRHADPALAADWPDPPKASGEPLRLRRDASGHGAAFDAVLLPGGEVAVALGEPGVGILGVGGTLTRIWPVPASALVAVADSELLLVKDTSPMSAFTLLHTGTGEVLGSTPRWPWLFWARVVRGDLWYAASHTAAVRWVSVWRLPELDAPDLLRSDRHQAGAVNAHGQVLSSDERGERVRALGEDPATAPAWAWPGGAWMTLTDVGPLGVSATNQLIVHLGSRRLTMAGAPAGEVLTGDASERQVAVALRTPADVRVWCWELGTGKLTASVVLTGARDLRLRLCAEALVLADDRGRVLVIEDGQVALEAELPP